MPAVGDAMAFFWVVVMRGGMKAWVVDETSKIALAFGEVVPMPTFPVAVRVIAVTGVPATLKRKYIFALTSL